MKEITLPFRVVMLTDLQLADLRRWTTDAERHSPEYAALVRRWTEHEAQRRSDSGLGPCVLLADVDGWTGAQLGKAAAIAHIGSVETGRDGELDHDGLEAIAVRLIGWAAARLAKSDESDTNA